MNPNFCYHKFYIKLLSIINYFSSLLKLTEQFHMRRCHSGSCQWVAGCPSQPPPGPLGGQLKQGLAQPALSTASLATPAPPPLQAMEGSGISYLLRSQILSGEKCPQQAVPVTKELPNKRKAESGLACQNLWRKWLHNWRCRIYFPGGSGVKPG